MITACAWCGIMPDMKSTSAWLNASGMPGAWSMCGPLVNAAGDAPGVAGGVEGPQAAAVASAATTTDRRSRVGPMRGGMRGE